MDCNTCRYRDYHVTKEPCNSCFNISHNVYPYWEPEVKEEDKLPQEVRETMCSGFCHNCSDDDRPCAKDEAPRLNPQDWEEDIDPYQGSDMIDHPPHYTDTCLPSKIECWDWYELGMTYNEFVGAMKNNILKYIFRIGHKEDPITNLKKARKYLDRWIEYEEGNRIVWMRGKRYGK